MRAGICLRVLFGTERGRTAEEKKKRAVCGPEGRRSTPHFTTCKLVWLAQSQPCSLPGPRRQPGVIWRVADHTSSVSRCRPSPSSVATEAGGQVSKGRGGVSWLGAKDPGLFMAARAGPHPGPFLFTSASAPPLSAEARAGPRTGREPRHRPGESAEPGSPQPGPQGSQGAGGPRRSGARSRGGPLSQARAVAATALKR